MKRIVSVILAIVFITSISISLADENREKAFETTKEASISILKEIQHLYDQYGNNVLDRVIRMAYAYLVLYTGSYIVVQAEQVDTAEDMFPSIREIYRLGYTGDNLIVVYTNITNEAIVAWSKFVSGQISKSEATEAIMHAVKNQIDLYDSMLQRREDEK